MKTLTVFTPTYNRQHLLHKLYQSLCEQTCQDFVWLIVDDGSVDRTSDLIQEWIQDGKLEINYYYQNNAGKMSAHNYGAKLTETELFFCVDSDDCLRADAIGKIIDSWEKIKNNNDVYGILAFKGYSTDKPITKIANKKVKMSTLRDAYTKYGCKGDTALIFRSNVLKKYCFPVYEGEKFVPEAYLYDQLDQEGKLYIVREILYLVEYLEEGYSANISKILYKNPRGYFDYINQRIKLDSAVREKYWDSVRYVAMAIAHKKKKIIINAVYPGLAVLAFLPGIVLYKIKYAPYVKRRLKEHKL